MGARFSCVVIAVALALASSPGAAQSAKTGESSSKPHAKARENDAPDPGAIADGIYRNASLNFSYKVPFGWVDRTSDMREGSELGKSLLLLSVFERPPEARAEGVDSAVVIAAENVSSYPGLKTAADYFGPLTELTTSKGFKADGEPYEFAVDAKPLVRGDFTRESGALTMHQTSLVFLQRDWIISVTLIGSSDDEIDELLGNLNFGERPAQRRHRK
jgi:hypothetical protein